MSNKNIGADNPQFVSFSANKGLVRQKLLAMLRDGAEKFKIITDFDATLTTPTSPSSWAIVETNPTLSQSYRDYTGTLLRKYHPMEISSTLSHDEKCTAMIEWSTKALAALCKERVTRECYESQLLASAQDKIHLRKGADDLFYLSSKLQIPCLIFSAGVGDVIDAVMLRHFSHCYHPSNPYYPSQRMPTALQKEAALASATLASESNNGESFQPQDEKKPLPPLSVSTSLPPLTPNTAHPNAAMSPKSHAKFAANNFGVVPGIPRTIYIIANHFEFQSAEAAVNDGNTSGAEPAAVASPNSVVRFDPFTHRPDDVICGFYDSENIHVFNKRESLLATRRHNDGDGNDDTNADAGDDNKKCAPKADYYSTQVQPRTNALLLGDSLGDAAMAAEIGEGGVSGSNNAVVLRVAFLNTSAHKTVASHLAAYLAKFDIVFVDSDDGIAFGNTVMKYFLESASDSSSSSTEEFVDTFLLPAVEEVPATAC